MIQMDLFKPCDLRKGFTTPKKPIPRRRHRERLLVFTVFVLAGLWIHGIASNSNKEWFSGFRSSHQIESERNVASSPARLSPVVQAWVKYSSANNETRELLDQWRNHKESECNTVETSAIRILGLPDTTPGSPVRLQSGLIHTIFIESLDDKEGLLCEGGDYYETDLSGEKWKSRPPVRDLHNGTYEVLLQVDDRFTGLYTFKVILLFSRFHGLEMVSSPSPFFRGGEVANFQILFEHPQHSPNDKQLPQPSLCKDGDYNLGRWSGRWTRSQKNESCTMNTEGRYQCLPPNTPCELPWCEGPLDKVDSNGWVYSAHCRFRLFTPDEAWNCLDKKWLFSWGDSTSQHTWQNLLAFIMDHGSISATDVPRRMDKNWVRPGIEGSKSDGVSQFFRLTMIYNGHSEEEGQFQGLESLNVPFFREYLRTFFVNSSDPSHSPPDIIVMNSGLHDAFHYESPDEYVKKGVWTAVEFWKEILETIKPHIPQIIYRTSIATAGNEERSRQYNPQKIESYNRLFVDSLLNLSPSNFRIVDGFDLTFPWHYDTECSDGRHYGLKPNLGVPGHQYFVDHMFAHMLLNSICLR